jgi:hypothetical protein
VLGAFDRFDFMSRFLSFADMTRGAFGVPFEACLSEEWPAPSSATLVLDGFISKVD